MSAHRSGGAMLLFALLVALPLPPAVADLMVSPTRIVFEKNQRAAQLDLINNGKESATYRISVVNRRMSETGEFIPIESAGPGEQFAGDLLRYSPRQVVLAPGAGQVVRIMVRKPAGLADGEYRSHLQFDRIPTAEGATSIAAPAAAAPGELAVRLTMMAGLSITVIVRQGENTAKAAISALELPATLDGQRPAVAAVLHRSGNSSIYGDLAVTFTPRGGEAVTVGKAGGVAVYAPNPLRRLRINLEPPAGLALTRGTLRLTYRERPATGDKLLAEAAIELP
ncbi:fimbrial biogenesis chaperone [Massilia glaciei]|uniref:Molecular chaperone n=1 Tax=Massilia glaciei TaxID=1524097 RepID=A0A2U2HKD0_9BURK|nr:fimbria/pilus periplasmic chaperone [Massilia glaciei]PWF47997.1 molecular chaperone [Massilia glaciei]